jgi:hypothetical protein
LHACQQSFRRQRADAGALERSNIFPLSRNLLPHALDFGADLLKFHGDAFSLIRTKREHICKLQIGLDNEIGAGNVLRQISRSRLPPDEPGTTATLRTLSVEAYQPKLFEENLSREEADRRIEALRQEIALANTF